MEIPGLVVIVAVAVVLVAVGIGAWSVWSSGQRDGGDRGAFSSESQTKADFAAFGTTIEGGGSDPAAEVGVDSADDKGGGGGTGSGS